MWKMREWSGAVLAEWVVFFGVFETGKAQAAGNLETAGKSSDKIVGTMPDVQENSF